MIQRRDIQETIYKYIAKQMNCGIQDLHAGETIFIEDDNKPEKYIKILSVEDTNIITLSSDLFSDGMRQLRGKSRDESGGLYGEIPERGFHPFCGRTTRKR